MSNTIESYYNNESREEGKDPESIQLSTTPDPGHRESDKNTWKHHTQESQEVNPFSAGDRKAARNRKDSMIKTNTNTQITKRIHKKKLMTVVVVSVSKKYTNFHYSYSFSFLTELLK